MGQETVLQHSIFPIIAVDSFGVQIIWEPERQDATQTPELVQPQIPEELQETEWVLYKVMLLLAIDTNLE
jgi:hypothetical protein